MPGRPVALPTACGERRAKFPLFQAQGSCRPDILSQANRLLSANCCLLAGTPLPVPRLLRLSLTRDPPPPRDPSSRKPQHAGSPAGLCGRPPLRSGRRPQQRAPEGAGPRPRCPPAGLEPGCPARQVRRGACHPEDERFPDSCSLYQRPGGEGGLGWKHPTSNANLHSQGFFRSSFGPHNSSLAWPLHTLCRSGHLSWSLFCAPLSWALAPALCWRAATSRCRCWRGASLGSPSTRPCWSPTTSPPCEWAGPPRLQLCPALTCCSRTVYWSGNGLLSCATHCRPPPRRPLCSASWIALYAIEAAAVMTVLKRCNYDPKAAVRPGRVGSRVQLVSQRVFTTQSCLCCSLELWGDKRRSPPGTAWAL